jgi:replicative DNA helicase
MEKNTPPTPPENKGVPQNIAMEQAVLGALLAENHAWAKVSNRLRPPMFMHTDHRAIYMIMTQLVADGKPIDILTVIEKSDNIGLGSPEFRDYILKIASKVASAANIEHHAAVIEQKFVSRELMRISDGLKMSASKGDDPLALLDVVKRQLLDVTPKTGNRLISAVDRWPEAAKNLEKNAQRFLKGITLAGISSGIGALDRMTLGWMDGEYYLFAARPAMGKTALILKFAMAAAVAGHPVHITSLEMGGESLIRRLIAYETGISTWQMRRGELNGSDFERMNAAASKLLKNLYIDDGSARDIDSIYNSCYGFSLDMKSVTDKKPLYMLDYAQLGDGNGAERQNSNREQVISRISRGLKSIARDMNAPMIALSQLSRQVENRADKKPLMSDLRESGSLEQDADMIGFLYRPEYYGLATYADGTSTSGNGQILIEKYREGGTGDVLLGWNGARGWYDLDGGFTPSSDLNLPKIQPNMKYSEPAHSDEQPNIEEDLFPY